MVITMFNERDIAKHRDRPMTLAAWEKVAEALGDKFTQAAEAHNRLLERVKRLEAELSEARAKSLTNYEGVWRDNNLYQRGVFVTHRGSLWHAESTTDEKPGTSPAWRLAVKSGERP